MQLSLAGRGCTSWAVFIPLPQTLLSLVLPQSPGSAPAAPFPSPVLGFPGPSQPLQPFLNRHNKVVETPLTVNLHRPPRSSLLSKQVGSRPSSRQHLMEARPLTPAPTIATRLAMLSCVGKMRQSFLLIIGGSPTPFLAALTN